MKYIYYAVPVLWSINLGYALANSNYDLAVLLALLVGYSSLDAIRVSDLLK